MKKLYINVDRCEVIGGAPALSPIVSEMDRRLQELASETASMATVLLKFSGSNSSEQYEKATVAVYNLSEELYMESDELNKMQHEIVKYQESITKFNDKSDSFSSPNAHNVQKVQISVDTNHFQFTHEEMVYVNQSIQKYTSDARDTLKRLTSNKEAIGEIWRDPQYGDFSDFIDEVVSKTDKSISVLEEYSVYLARKISELKN